MDFSTEELAEIKALVSKKKQDIEWVILNKEPKDPAALAKRVEIQASILAKLGADTKKEE